jgi:hypothetical protein
MSVPLLILGLAQLAIFALMAVLASTSAYFPFDVPVERWIQELLGGTAPWLFSAVTALNGARQTFVGFLLLLLVVILNPRAIVFAVLASLTGPIYFFVNRRSPGRDRAVSWWRSRSTSWATPFPAATQPSRLRTRRCWFCVSAAST